MLPQTLDGKLDHVVEECSEVIKAVVKGRRFGWEPTQHEGIHYNNREHLLLEMRDLRMAMNRLETEIAR